MEVPIKEDRSGKCKMGKLSEGWARSRQCLTTAFIRTTSSRR